MRKQRALFVTVTVASLALGGVMMARMTAAQGPGNRGGGRGAPGRNFPGGPGAPGGAPPVMMGTLTESDAGMGTLAFTPFGGGEQTIRVTNNTKYSTQTTATVADLKVNDQIQVQGVPTSITASSILAGDLPPIISGGPNGPGGPGGPGGSNGPGAIGQGGAPQQRGPASATATGRVTSLSPLTISIGSDITITLKLAPNARVSKIVPTSFSKLKAGDRIIAMGQTGNDGTFTATRVAINLEMPGMGPGGFDPMASGGPGRPGGPLRPGAPGGTGAPGGGNPSGTEPDRGTPVNAAAATSLIQANCRCHNGGQGPDLSHEGSRQNAVWIAGYITNPRSKNPSSRMPAMGGRLSSQQISTIANYLASLK